MIDLNGKYRTRDGKRETVEITYLERNNEDMKIFAKFNDGFEEFYYEDGFYFETGDTNIDLVPIEQPKIYGYMNVYRGEDGGAYFGHLHACKDEAGRQLILSCEKHTAMLEVCYDPNTKTTSSRVVEGGE